LRRENPPADWIGEHAGESGERTGSFALAERRAKTFAAEGGQKARFPGWKLDEELLGGGVGSEPIGKDLEIAVDDVSERANSEGAFRTVEGGGMLESRGWGVWECVGRSFAKTSEGVKVQRQAFDLRRGE